MRLLKHTMADRTQSCRHSVMITTRNRLDDLRRTVGELKKLEPQPDEILITADGCSDGTAEFVRRALPAAKLIVNAVGQGSVASRDRMLREATSELVLALDDDSYPEQRDCVARLSRLFAARPNLAVAHFPQRSDEYPESLNRVDFGAERLTRSFANSGACFRRSIYLSLPGFEPRFFHMYEEPDYALQCVAAGFDVLYTPVVTIRHHWSARSRNEVRVHQQHARNAVWSAAMRCPFPQVLLIIAAKMLVQFGVAFRRGPSWFLREPVWWWRALRGTPHILRKRQPVAWSGYRSWLRLVDKQYVDAVAENPTFWKSRRRAPETCAP